MEKEEETCRIVCREDVRSLNSWSELTYDTLLKSSVKDKPEKDEASNRKLSNLSEQTWEGAEKDQNGLPQSVEDLEICESDDDDNIFFISSPSMNVSPGREDVFDTEPGARNCESLPYFSSLPLDIDQLYNNSPRSLPPDYKNIAKTKPVNICSECNKIFTDSCSCQNKEDSLTTRKSESHLKDLFKTKSPSQHIFKPKGINFQNRKHIFHSRTSPEFGHSTEETDQSDKVKNKLMSVWNNVKYGKCRG